MMTNTTDDCIPYEQPETGEVIAPSPSPLSTTASVVTAFLMFSGPGFAAYLPPPTYEPGFDAPAPYTQFVQEARTKYSGYRLEQVDAFVISDFITKHPVLSTFIEKLKVFTQDVYGSDVNKSLKYHSGFEGDGPLLEVILYTGLPIDDLFEKKDRLLFGKIQQADLVEALKYIVLSHG